MVRIVGAMLIVFASGGLALSRALDEPVLLKGIRWFGIGHGVLWLVLLGQRVTILRPTTAMNLATGLALLLFAGLMWVHEAETARGARPGGRLGEAAAMHSRYDQAIREAASQEERHRLARDLHDSIKQQIFAMQTAAATAEARLDGGSNSVRDALTLVRSAAREAMTEMEAMLDQLRASPLDNAGLVAALQKQCDALRFRTGANMYVAIGALPPDGEIGPGVRPALLRIAQEALANVARHARAHKVTLMLGSSGRGLDLSISDDGAGFDQTAPTGGMGLHNMHSRAADVEGELTVVSAPGTGTTVRVLVPALGWKPRVGVNRWKPWHSTAIWMMAMFFASSFKGLIGPVITIVLGVTWIILNTFDYFRSRPVR